jgi:hypothetical protein
MNDTLRKVVRTRFVTNKYCRIGEGCIWHSLECGHETVNKQSDGTPSRKRCRECGHEKRREIHQAAK